MDFSDEEFFGHFPFHSDRNNSPRRPLYPLIPDNHISYPYPLLEPEFEPGVSSEQDHGPIIHEGFIPHHDFPELQHSHGERQDLDGIRPFTDHTHALPDGSRGEDNDEDLMSIDEHVLPGSIPDTNDPAVDPDYDVSDALSPSEMSLSDGVSEDESREGRRASKRSRGSSRGRGRGRGRGGRGGTRGGPVSRGRQSRPNEGRRGRRGGKRARLAKDPGPLFKQLHQDAVAFYLADKLEEARKCALEAVELNPGVFSAHSLLSEIYASMGRHEDSTYALFAGAHTIRDANLWWLLANNFSEFLETKTGKDRLELQRHILTCYRWFISLEKDRDKLVLARSERLRIHMELGELSRAKSECEMLLKLRPYDADILQQFADICIQVKDLGKAESTLSAAINHWLSPDATEDPELNWSCLNVYLELLDRLGKYKEGVNELRRCARWLVGRGNESFWDSQEDDREWDIDDRRRSQVKEYLSSSYGVDRYGMGLPLDLRVKLGQFRLRTIPPNIEEALHHFRFLDLSLNKSDSFGCGDLLSEAGDSLRDCSMYKEALHYYEHLWRLTESLNPSFYFNIATCYVNVGQTEDAVKFLRIATQVDEQNFRARIDLTRLYQDIGLREQAVAAAEEVYALGRADLLRKAGLQELLDEQREEHTTTHAARKIRRPGTRGAERTSLRPLRPQIASENTPEQKAEKEERRFWNWYARKSNAPARLHGLSALQQQRLNEARARDIVLRHSYQEMKSLDEDMEAGDVQATAQWMKNAEALVSEFRKTRVFFPTRNKNVPFRSFAAVKAGGIDSAVAFMGDAANQEHGGAEQDSAGTNISDRFHEIKFADWFELFCKYAMQLAKQGESKACWEILETVCDANVFYHNRDYSHATFVLWLACAIYFNDEAHMSYVARWFIKRYPYSADPFRLYSAVNRLFVGDRTWYNSGPSQKYMLRLIKQMDFSLLTPQQRKLYNFTDQDHSSFTLHGQVKDGNRANLKELSPVLLSLYGHILCQGQAYLQALNYYFRAYSLVPDDPVVNLCLATTYVQMALKRICDNRQYHISQGLAFLYRYHDLRTREGVPAHTQEAEFNVARMWHGLGVLDLAVKSYEKVLQLSDSVRKDPNRGCDDGDSVEDFAAEAAFALQGIFAINEDMESAKMLTEKWLVI